MPDSGPTETPAHGAGGGDRSDGRAREEIAALERAVERLVEAFTELDERVESAESARRSVAEALAEAGPDELSAEEAEEKFRRLVEENRRLREAVEEGRERAERIRSRLIMMEDEL